MKLYNLFWQEIYGTSWAFLGSYDSEEKAKKGIDENLKFRNISDEDLLEEELEDYLDDYFIAEVDLNNHVVKEFH